MRIRRISVAFLFCAGVSTLFLETTTSQELSLPIASIVQELPGELSNEVFWQMIHDFSEPGGYFRSDNFVSNETTFQEVIPELTRSIGQGGVYLGVGPDQNFTYIAALQPRIAFIVDIRRQNMVQHLMYKALFELSDDRADFLSQLFSRPRPPDVGSHSTTEELFGAFNKVEPDSEMFLATLTALNKHLVEDHGFPLTFPDQANMRYVLRAFYEEGPQLTYNGQTRFRGPQTSPTYADMMRQTDGNEQNRSYIGSERNFRRIQDLEKRNLVVPLVGDFAGEKAIRQVAQYLKDHNASVAVFYLSNVEQYLFEQEAAWHNFYTNVANLPVDSSSTFIRSFFYGTAGRLRPPSSRSDGSASLLCSIEYLLDAFRAGRIQRYSDVIYLSTF